MCFRNHICSICYNVVGPLHGHMAADVVSAMACIFVQVSSANDSADASLIKNMVPVDQLYEKVGQPTIDTNEELLAKSVTDFEKHPPKSTLHHVLTRYRELRAFPPNPRWVKDEEDKVGKTWRYVLTNTSRSSGSPYDSMRRLKKILRSRQPLDSAEIPGYDSVLTDPYKPGKLDVSEGDASGEDMSDENGDDSIPNGQPHPQSPMAADEPAAQAADGAPTCSLARHISSVSVVSSAPADDPAAVGGPTPVEFPPSPLFDYDCTQHRDLVKRRKN